MFDRPACFSSSPFAFVLSAFVPLFAALISLTLGCSDAGQEPAVQERPAVRAAAPEAATIRTLALQAPGGTPDDQPPGVTPEDQPRSLADWVRSARSGSLILRTQEASGRGPVVAAGPGLGSEIDIAVTATIARATLRQKFRNPTDRWVEGIYVFPLPDDAAVDHLRILTDDRIIEGLIQEKEEARETYEAAKARGAQAGLVEQERPNVFTTSIANIRPGGEITVEIEYQQSVLLDDGRFSLRVPTVVGPRYLPGQMVVEAPAPETIHPFQIEIDLAPGFDIDVLESATHPIAISDDGYRYRVTLAGGPVPGDRDFVLHWTPAAGQEPEAIVFTETLGSDHYALMMVTPPLQPEAAMSMPREVVYVVDTSGSMAGTSMLQAKTALTFGLERLGSEDHFNVIQFDDTASALFSQARPATPRNVETALAHVSAFTAAGGTEIAQAIRLALVDDDSRGSLRQVIFLTDGSVGNEAQLLQEIEQRLGESRVFAIGIGGAPNTFFMRKLAQLGRGSFTHIGSPYEVAGKMTTLFRKLDSALLADIEIGLREGTTVEMYPYEVPDLYAGEPIVVALKLDSPLERTIVTGWNGDTFWQKRIAESDIQERSGIHVLWARQAIAERMDDRLRTNDEQVLIDLRAEVVELSLEHHLVSAFTSLVAVDVTPERPSDQLLEEHGFGTQLPPGWQSDARFGFEQGATPANLHIWLGLWLVSTAGLWRRVVG